MRYPLLLVVTLAAAGCAATRVIEIDPADSERVVEFNTRMAERSATVRFNPGSTVRFIHVNRGAQVVHDSLQFITGGGLPESVPLTEVRQVLARDRGRLIWPLIGAGLGGPALGIYLVSINEPGGFFTISDGGAFSIGFVGGSLGGLVVGSIAGAITGERGVIYRFRPDTPQQMSVVIGVGPGEK